MIAWMGKAGGTSVFQKLYRSCWIVEKFGLNAWQETSMSSATAPVLLWTRRVSVFNGEGWRVYARIVVGTRAGVVLNTECQTEEPSGLGGCDKLCLTRGELRHELIDRAASHTCGFQGVTTQRPVKSVDDAVVAGAATAIASRRAGVTGVLGSGCSKECLRDSNHRGAEGE